MPAPASVIELIERFHENAASYRSGRYNETQVRVEFINPLFEALGWDMQNKRGLPQDQQDVIHEDAIKVRTGSKLEELPLFQLLDDSNAVFQAEPNGIIETNYAEAFRTSGGTKAPDYGFRVGGERKFFLEAKKPSVNIKGDIHPAFQLRRYGWSANLPLSILTDFEELAVYDCRVRPEKSDKAAVARTMYLTYTEYADKWDDITRLFSREAVLSGSLDTYIESAAKRKGLATVDAVFLKEIEGWRAALAHNIAVWNKDLNQRELNYAVQMTIDRIIFLRICEDRGIEPYGRLQALYGGRQLYSALGDLFREADDRYNSGLFHFKKEKDRSSNPDDWTLNLYIEDEPLKRIVKHLYYPDSPYEFSVLPIELLGQVYEQFLGKVIHLSSDRRAVVEEKPEVRKAGGVYYTPSYIVDYIVKHTIGELLDAKTPKQVTKLKILDPSCGSGSFLIGAYQYLLDWHREYYLNDGPERHKKALYQASGGVWKLTTAERRRILLNNIYGVDIDTQAVEVTKLSLLLKVLEGETEQTLTPQLRLLQERALPDLGSNIKCGNTLIASDFYDMQQLSLLDEEDEQRINVFDWESGFSQIMEDGGFDAVIGNPPWISLSGKFGNDVHSEAEVNYLINRYGGNTYMPNMYEYFVAKGLDLVRDSGYFSFVVPDRLGFNSQFINLRKRILMESSVVSLLYKTPFPKIVADTLIFVLRKESNGLSNNVTTVAEFGSLSISRNQHEFLQNSNYLFDYFVDSSIMQLMSKVSSVPQVVTLQEICDTTSGFGGKSHLIQEVQTSPDQIKTLKGDSIVRYHMRKVYWFDFRKENITGRTTDRNKLGASPKILLRKTGDRIVATYDESGVFPEQSLYFLYNNRTEISFKYLLGILNSKFLTAYYRTKSLTNKNTIAQVKKVDLDQLPIFVPNLSIEQDKSRYDQMVILVERMLVLCQQSVVVKTSYDKDRVLRQIDATEKQIDYLVYELYGLGSEEIRIVEAITKSTSLTKPQG